MSIIAIITTIAYAITLPVIVETKHLYNRVLVNLFDILIKVQKVLIEFADRYLCPWITELINFKSIGKLYQDIKEGKLPEECINEYIKRSGLFEYLFMIITSMTFLILVIKVIILPLESHIFIIMFEEKDKPSAALLLIFKIGFYPFAVVSLYNIFTYILYFLNSHEIPKPVESPQNQNSHYEIFWNEEMNQNTTNFDSIIDQHLVT